MLLCGWDRSLAVAYPAPKVAQERSKIILTRECDLEG